MFLLHTIKGVVALALLACLAACGLSQGIHRDTFKPYEPDVVQGNVVSQEQQQALVLGMTRAQVRDILGTPLVTSVFHGNRWDYAFTIRRQGVEAQNFHLTVHFDGDRLGRVDADQQLPSEVEFVKRLSRPRAASAVPPLQATPDQLRAYPGAAASTQPPASAPAPAAPLRSVYPPLEAAPR